MRALMKGVECAIALGLLGSVLLLMYVALSYQG